MAKRFRFNLETVLKIRQQREDAAKRVVAARLRQIAEVEGEIAGLQTQIRLEIDAFRRSHAQGRIDVTRITRHRHWLIQLDQGVLIARHRMSELQQELARERAVLTEARKQVRVLEKLKERRYQRYRKELARAEARENDEIGNVLHMRQRAVAVE